MGEQLWDLGEGEEAEAEEEEEAVVEEEECESVMIVLKIAYYEPWLFP